MSTSNTSLTENFKAVQKASRSLVQLTTQQVNELLTSLAKTLINNSDEILKENQKDLDRMPVDDPKYDRLKLQFGV